MFLRTKVNILKNNNTLKRLLHILSNHKTRDALPRRTKTGMKEPMTVINPNLTADSSESEKFAAFVEAVMTGKVRGCLVKDSLTHSLAH